MADNDPFNGAEAYYADARFYIKAVLPKDTEKEKEGVKGESSESSKGSDTPKKTFRYVPRSQRKEGARALTPVDPSEALKPGYTLPERKTECTVVETYNKFMVSPKGKGSKSIQFHAMGKMDRPTPSDEETKVEDQRYASKETNFSTKTRQMLAKVGLNP